MMMVFSADLLSATNLQYQPEKQTPVRNSINDTRKKKMTILDWNGFFLLQMMSITRKTKI